MFSEKKNQTTVCFSRLLEPNYNHLAIFTRKQYHIYHNIIHKLLSELFINLFGKTFIYILLFYKLK